MKMNEVIIDGCNVAECNSFLNEYEFPNNLKGGYYTEKNLCECGVQGAESYPFFCKDNPDCYFKQLQRAKADIEELKEYNDSSDIDVRALLSDKDKLKAENEKLKQALKEIKEIVNSECKKCPDGTYTEDYCNGLAYCTLAKIIEVLYKGFVLRTINEVLND